MLYNGQQYYYVYDAQGNVTGIMDKNAQVVVRYSYDAWGRMGGVTGTMAKTVGTINPFRYRGYMYDTETGLYYLQSRYYNPVWGRFINADSILGSNKDVSKYNLFVYCGNNPVNFSDPTGHEPSVPPLSPGAQAAKDRWEANQPQVPMSPGAQAAYDRDHPQGPVAPPYFKIAVDSQYGRDLRDVDARLLNRLEAMGKAYGLTNITITNGYRAYNEQAALFKLKKGKGVNSPGKSWHEYGGAVDVVLWDSGLTDADFKKFGLCRPVKSENWHVQLIENSKGTTNATEGSAYYDSIEKWGYR